MKILMKIKSNNFIKSTLMVSGGTAIAQLIAFFSNPIITRIYSPEEYGILTIYASLIALVAGSQSLRYELAIPISGNDKKAINAVALSMFILIVFTLLITLIFIFFSDNILVPMSAEILQKYKYLVPVGIFLLGTYEILYSWNLRKKEFKIITTNKISQSLNSAIVKIVLGIINIGPIGLIIGNIIGQSAGIITLSKSILREKLFSYINLKDILGVSKKYITFPKYSFPSNIISKIADQIPVLFLASLFGGMTVGYFGLAKIVVSLPSSLIGKAVGDVFYSEAANLGQNKPKEIKSLSGKIFNKLFLLGLIPLLILLCTGPILFSVFFGENWYEAGVYAQILSLLAFSQLIFQPSSRILTIFRKEKYTFWLTCLRIILVLLVFSLSVYFDFNSYLTISGYVAVMFLVYLLIFFFSNRVLNNAIIKLNNDHSST